MTDKHGTLLKMGMRVRFWAPTLGLSPVEVTVRDIKHLESGLFARVDNGKTDDPSDETNGFDLVAWVRSNEIEVIEP
jgi:cobalamin biosynthesis protein CbiD